MISDVSSFSSEQLSDLIETVVFLADHDKVGLQVLEKRIFGQVTGISRMTYPLNVMIQRQKILGVNYPFQLTEVSVQRIRKMHESWYASLLALSPKTLMRTKMSPKDIAACAELFEKISTIAVRQLLGFDAKALRFAWPSDCGRPVEFPDAINWLAEKMGLCVGGYLPPRRKDGGVDIVGWQNFGDRRTGFPILLGQCTVQEDFLSKTLDIDLKNWGQWLKTQRDPMTALLLPSIIPGRGEDWNEIAQKHIVLDRIRLSRLLSQSSSSTQSIPGLTEFVTSIFARVQKSLNIDY